MSESIRTAPPFVERRWPLAPPRAATRPTAREWVRHAALFLLTALTATVAGVISSPEALSAPAPEIPVPPGWFEFILFLPAYYVYWVAGVVAAAVAHPAILADGLTFAGALLAILLAHEAGHYVACRRYGVDATLPFFIPAPPPFLAGTFGAFIKIRSPIPTRRALFDIGVAGPLAGFVATIPVAVAAVLTVRAPASALPAEGGIYLNDPLLIRLIAAAIDLDLSRTVAGPLYLAAWFGLLVTSLNLMPVGQLDGGHMTYALFGRRTHGVLGRAAFAVMVALAALGWAWHGVPSGFVYALLLAVMLRVRHPHAEDESALTGRALVAALTLVVFALSFMPFPITIK
ncbi:MAG: site-2 protease family protein [Pyrinomonadaceae bacterium]